MAARWRINITKKADEKILRFLRISNSHDSESITSIASVFNDVGYRWAMMTLHRQSNGSMELTVDPLD
jgi:hypothetical protein